MQTSWNLMVEALGAAACELAAAGVGEDRPRLMLHALGRELTALAKGPYDETSPRAAARALLLGAERAAKVSEALASMRGDGATGFHGAATGALHLAYTVATGAQLRAQALLPQLPDEELRANFEREFDSHARRTRELLAPGGGSSV